MKSLASRINQMDHKSDALAGIAPTVNPVHRQVVEVMAELMTMGRQLSGEGTPAYLKAFMRTIDQSQGLLVESIQNVPVDNIKAFIGSLIVKMQTIVDAPDHQ